MYRIIPFVAADAVFDEPATVYDNNYQPIEHVYNASNVEEPPSSIMNSFSPPIKTEGNLNFKNFIIYLVYIFMILLRH